MKHLFSFILLLGISGNLIAQAPFHKCGYDHAIYHLDQKYPGYKQQVDAVFDDASRRGEQLQYNRVVHTVPVAVHVVWKTADQKIPECKVVQQIEVLNEDYRRQNADAGNLRPIFNGIAADTEIEFRLDTIIWTQSNVDFHTLGPFGGFFPDPESLDSVKSVSPGLDPDQYLNIWAVNLGTGGLLGYAYPPDSMPNWPAGTAASSPDKEGVVLHNTIVGRSGSVTVVPPFGGASTTIVTQGRTATHEVGHYLGLRHIWGDGRQGGGFPQPSCSVDDGIGDTPNCLDRSDFDCDTTKNSCDTSLVNDMPDMVENYMDYSDETCMNTFTVGQKNLMKGVLTGARAGFLTTPDKNRPTNDAVSYAQNLTVNSTIFCTSSFSSSNHNASVSIPDAPCVGTIANDVWFSFTATETHLDLEFSNITAVSGTSTGMAFEVLEGACDSLVGMQCDTVPVGTYTELSGLTIGNTYYIRVYSIDANASQNFDICLYTVAVVGTKKAFQMSEKHINIYPNPTSGMVNIAIDNITNFEGTVALKNMLGQSISNTISIDDINNQLQIALPNETNGLFLVEIKLNGQVITKKIMVQKQ